GKDTYTSEDMGLLFASRACPFNCTFCSSAGIWGRKTRYRSVANIISEIKAVQKDYGTIQFSFKDDTFTLDKRRVLEFCRALREEDINIKWDCNARINLIDAELLKTMKQNGCNGLKVGIESGSDRILQLMQKGITTTQIRDKGKVLNQSGIHWTGYFMMGLPTETAEDMRTTARLMREIKPDFASLSVYEPFPGTELFELGVEKGLAVRERTLTDFYTLSPKYYYIKDAGHQIDTMPQVEFEALQTEIKNEFHHYNAGLFRILKRLTARSGIYLQEPVMLWNDFKKFLGWMGISGGRNVQTTDVLILSQYFYPDLASTGMVLTELAEDLVSSGIKVSALAGQPNYTADQKPAPARETYRGIEIKRLNYLRLAKDNLIGRLLSQITLFITVIAHLLFSGIKFNTLLIVSNPPFMPLAGWLLKKFRKFNFIFLMHDIYPDIAIKTNTVSASHPFTKLLNWATVTSLKSADHVVAIGFDAKEIIRQKGIAENKISVITNWADTNRIKCRKSIPREQNKFINKNNLQNKFVVLYTGNLGLTHNLESIIETADRLKQYDDLSFVFIGEGGAKKRLQQMVADKKLSNVLFFTYQPEEIYSDALSAGDLLLVTLGPGLAGLSVPSRTYTYMANGGPIVAFMDRESEIGRLVIDNSLGFCVEPNQVDKLAEKIVEFRNNPALREQCGANARSLFEQRFERRLVTAQFLKLL
ncbi:MAG: radical SAM protein, partial [Parcubacteria group bacterium]